MFLYGHGYIIIRFKAGRSSYSELVEQIDPRIFPPLAVLPLCYSSMLRRVFGTAQDALTRVIYGSEVTTAKMNFYSCFDKDMNGTVVPMSDFVGTVLLCVNVASK
jgi:hypothetical protein